MKSINVSTNNFKKITNMLLNGNSADLAHENICSELNLYGVKYFGHGTKYQKRKVDHLWRAVLFCIYDDTRIKIENKEQIKNYLEIN